MQNSALWWGKAIQPKSLYIKVKGCIPLDTAANMIKLSYLLPLLNMEIDVIVPSKLLQKLLILLI